MKNRPVDLQRARLHTTRPAFDGLGDPGERQGSHRTPELDVPIVRRCHRMSPVNVWYGATSIRNRYWPVHGSTSSSAIIPQALAKRGYGGNSRPLAETKREWKMNLDQPQVKIGSVTWIVLSGQGGISRDSHRPLSPRTQSRPGFKGEQGRRTGMPFSGNGCSRQGDAKQAQNPGSWLVGRARWSSSLWFHQLSM